MPTIQAQGAIAEWTARLESLVASVGAWAAELGWSTRQTEKKMEDSDLGQYRVPALLIQRETVRILLEPIARSAPGAEGVVDLYLLPAYDDIASLYFYAQGWMLHYPFPGSPVVSAIEEIEPRPLTRDALEAVLTEMSNNAA